MQLSKTLLSLAMTAALLAGCKQKQADAPAAPPAADPAVATDAGSPAPATDAPAAATAAAPVASSFDINAIPVSDKPLPAWPYVILPSGYHFYHDDDMASRSKDLARVPLWTGGQLLWVEGKVFSDAIDNVDGKTYSRFEVRKNVQQAIEALGGVRLSERSFDEAVYKANEKALDDFRQEFDRMQSAYWYDADVDTYVLHRADKAIWVVFQSGNERGALMIAEGPLPETPKH